MTATVRNSRVVHVPDDGGHADPGLYRCGVVLTPEPDGGYSVTVPALRGVASQGETVADALANVTEAMEGVLESYAARGVPVPWTPVAGLRPGTHVVFARKPPSGGAADAL